MISYLKKHWQGLLIAILIPELVGQLSNLLAGDVRGFYNELVQPPLAPPGWVFAVVWPILYLLMGVASYLIYEQRTEEGAKKALTLYGVQLFLNFTWTIVFFRFHMLWAAVGVLVLLLITVVWMIAAFRKINKMAAWLLIPYLLWLLFAAYLNIGVALLNK